MTLEKEHVIEKEQHKPLTTLKALSPQGLSCGIQKRAIRFGSPGKSAECRNKHKEAYVTLSFLVM